MFEKLGGLQIVEPGYKKSLIAPLVGQGGLTNAQCSIQTPHGLLATEWTRAGHKVTLNVTIPPNTTATVCLPGEKPVEVGSGQHQFISASLP
jgi:alpha-L-rhamnosidase